MWLLCVAAHTMAGEHGQALDTAKEAMERFPNNAFFCYYAGENCQAQRRYDEAFSWWKKALSLDKDFMDAMYSMAACREELGDYKQAHRIWNEIADQLDRRGLVIEAKYPREQADHCRRHME